MKKKNQEESKDKKQKRKRGGRSVQELMGIRSFTRYGLDTVYGELLFFRIAPVNISVLSHDNIEIKIHSLQTALTMMPDLEIIRPSGKQIVAGLSCDDSTNVGTPVPKGAARRDPRRGESPVTRSQARFPSLPSPGEVVSNTGSSKQSNFRRAPPCCFCALAQTAGRLLSFGRKLL